MAFRVVGKNKNIYMLQLRLRHGRIALSTAGDTYMDNIIDLIQYGDSTEEDYIADLYFHLANTKSLRSLYLPHSDVYYVRNAIHKRFGVWMTCQEVQKIMEEEAGWDKH